jgi:hypothetical protein
MLELSNSIIRTRQIEEISATCSIGDTGRKIDIGMRMQVIANSCRKALSS